MLFGAAFAYARIMKKIYIVPNVITAFSLATGLFVIFKVNMIEPGMGTYKSLMASSLLILVAALADWIDGAIARIMHAESRFGVFLDSMADAVTFGVAPSVLVLKSLSLERGTFLSFLAIIGSMIFSICGILRLTRFSVKQMDPSKESHKGKAHHFTGMPIPAAALALVGTNLLIAYPWFEEWANWNEEIETIVLTSVAIVLGYFMVSRFKFPSAKALHFQVPSFHLVFFLVLAVFFLLYGGIYFFPITLFTVAWLYIFTGWTLMIIRRIAGKKSKTLEEFEPENDD